MYVTGRRQWAPPPALSAVSPGGALVSRLVNGAENPRRLCRGQCGAGAPAHAASGHSPRSEWAAVPARTQRRRRRPALPGLSRSAFQSVWPAECAALLSEAGDPAQRGLLSPQAPSAKKAIVRAARPAGGACSSAHAPAEGGPRARPLGSAGTPGSACHGVARPAAAGSGQDECPLLSAELFYLHFLNSLSR